MRLGDTPVLIPNTMVKTQAADDTWLETARESRWLPDKISISRDIDENGTEQHQAVWGCSSVGRAPALQAGGHEFESHHLHGGEILRRKEHSSLYLENIISKRKRI